MLSVCVDAVDNSTSRIKLYESPLHTGGQGKHSKQNIASVLDNLVALGMLEVVRSNGSAKFKFSHDQIQEAAYSLAPDGLEKQKLYLVIGSAIRCMNLSPDQCNWQLLMAVNQLNRTMDLVVDKKEKVKLAELNLEAANLVISQSAFFPAVGYLKLHEGNWKG